MNKLPITVLRTRMVKNMVTKEDMKEILRESPLFVWVDEADVESIVEGLHQRLLTTAFNH